MMLEAVIRRNSDGSVRTHREPMEADEEDAYYAWINWTSGNKSCDCNRSMLFGDDEVACGDDAYSLLSLTLDGQDLLKGEVE